MSLPHTAELTAALSSLEKIAWMRLDDETVRFTVIPDQGSQVWAYVLFSSLPCPGDGDGD
jgi:hypothetical protein